MTAPATPSEGQAVITNLPDLRKAYRKLCRLGTTDAAWAFLPVVERGLAEVAERMGITPEHARRLV